jgi:hypothetical protein
MDAPSRHRDRKDGGRFEARLAGMSDLVYVAITVAFFAASALYVRFCDEL